MKPPKDFIENTRWYQSFDFGDFQIKGEKDTLSDFKKAYYFPKDFTGRTYLDIGCNAGAYCVEAFRRGAKRVVGLDPNPEWIRIAQKCANYAGARIEYYVLPGEKADRVGIFDYVGCFSVLHLDETRRTAWEILETASQVCKGTLFVEIVPSLMKFDSFLSYYCLGCKGKRKKVEKILRRFVSLFRSHYYFNRLSVREKMEKILESIGWGVVEYVGQGKETQDVFRCSKWHGIKQYVYEYVDVDRIYLGLSSKDFVLHTLLRDEDRLLKKSPHVQFVAAVDRGEDYRSTIYYKWLERIVSKEAVERKSLKFMELLQSIKKEGYRLSTSDPPILIRSLSTTQPEQWDDKTRPRREDNFYKHRDYEILTGHHRLAVMAYLGWDRVPAVFV